MKKYWVLQSTGGSYGDRVYLNEKDVGSDLRRDIDKKSKWGGSDKSYQSAEGKIIGWECGPLEFKEAVDYLNFLGFEPSSEYPEEIRE